MLLYYWIYLTRCEKEIKCSASLAFYLFSPTRLINSIKHEHSCKILYVLKGPCDSDDDDLLTCNNGRCIDKKFTCRDWNACGDNSDCVDDRFILDEELLRYIKIGGVVVTCVITIYCLYLCECVEKCLKKCFETCLDCASVIRYICRDVDCSCCRDLLSGAFESCRRLKSNLTSRQEVFVNT